MPNLSKNFLSFLSRIFLQRLIYLMAIGNSIYMRILQSSNLSSRLMVFSLQQECFTALRTLSLTYNRRSHPSFRLAFTSTLYIGLIIYCYIIATLKDCSPVFANSSKYALRTTLAYILRSASCAQPASAGADGLCQRKVSDSTLIVSADCSKWSHQRLGRIFSNFFVRFSGSITAYRTSTTR